MLTFDDINTLADIIDTTWGKSSTEVAPTMSIKTVLDGDKMYITYVTTVTYRGTLTHKDLEEQFEQAQSAIKSYVSDVKKQFKKNTGNALKLKIIEYDQSVEAIDLNTFSPMRTVYTAYYRCIATAELD